jgi:DNA-directed RNA polymerase subunit RPC12/RpoP
MSIVFLCERCGHRFDVDDDLAGKRARCKHCGHVLVIPAPALRLRPVDGQEPARVADHLLAPPAGLTVRPAEAEPRRKPQAVSDPDSDSAAGSQPARHGGTARAARGSEAYPVLDPHRLSEVHSSLGPPPRWTLLPSLTARFATRRLRRLRDWLYVVSLAFLVMVLIGYLFQLKILLHLGALGVIAANIGMLATGVVYLVALPFRESLLQGLANLIIPFYAIYYWTTRWPRMKTAVFRTLGAFVPILLVAVAYLAYEEAPVVESTIEKEVPALEKAIETQVPALDQRLERVLEPLEKSGTNEGRAR